MDKREAIKRIKHEIYEQQLSSDINLCQTRVQSAKICNADVFSHIRDIVKGH